MSIMDYVGAPDRNEGGRWTSLPSQRALPASQAMVGFDSFNAHGIGGGTVSARANNRVLRIRIAAVPPPEPPRPSVAVGLGGLREIPFDPASYPPRTFM